MELEIMNLIREEFFELEKIVGLEGNWKHPESFFWKWKILVIFFFFKFS